MPSSPPKIIKSFDQFIENIYNCSGLLNEPLKIRWNRNMIKSLFHIFCEAFYGDRLIFLDFSVDISVLNSPLSNLRAYLNLKSLNFNVGLIELSPQYGDCPNSFSDAGPILGQSQQLRAYELTTFSLCHVVLGKSPYPNSFRYTLTTEALYLHCGDQDASCCYIYFCSTFLTSAWQHQLHFQRLCLLSFISGSFSYHSL